MESTNGLRTDGLTGEQWNRTIDPQAGPAFETGWEPFPAALHRCYTGADPAAAGTLSQRQFRGCIATAHPCPFVACRGVVRRACPGATTPGLAADAATGGQSPLTESGERRLESGGVEPLARRSLLCLRATALQAARENRLRADTQRKGRDSNPRSPKANPG